MPRSECRGAGARRGRGPSGPGACRPGAAAGPAAAQRGIPVALLPLGRVVEAAEAAAGPATACPLSRKVRSRLALPAAAPIQAGGGNNVPGPKLPLLPARSRTAPAQ
jgi:hypothetical protein